jgi:hypothetical protein
MGRLKDLATGLEVDAGNIATLGVSPIQYIVVDEDEIDLDEVNFELQVAADEARANFDK